MQSIRKNQSGFGLILTLIAIGGIMIVGYILISRLTASETGQDATELIDKAVDTVDKANDAGNRARGLIDDANNAVDNVTE